MNIQAQNFKGNLIKYLGTLTKTLNYDINSIDRSYDQNLDEPSITNREVWSCVYSPDDQFLAWSTGNGTINCRPINDFKSADENDFNSSNDKNSNRAIEIDCHECIYALAFGSSKPHFKKLKTGKLNQSKVNTRYNYSCEHNDDILLLAAGDRSGKIRIYDVQSNKFLFFLFDHKEAIRSLKFSKDGSLILASTANDGKVKMWNMLDDGNMYRTLSEHVGKGIACFLNTLFLYFLCFWIVA